MITSKKTYESSVLGIEVNTIEEIRSAQEESLGNLLDGGGLKLTGTQIQLLVDRIRANEQYIIKLLAEMNDASGPILNIQTNYQSTNHKEI